MNILVEAVLGTVTLTQLRHTIKVRQTWKDENLVLSKELIKVDLPLRRSEYAGLTIGRSAFQIFHGGNSAFINSSDKTKFSCFTLPPAQHHSFFRNKKFVNIEICLSYVR